MNISFSPFMQGQYGANAITQYASKQQEEAKERMGIEDPSKANDPLQKAIEEHKNGCECETCKRRKYKDGSNEMVSFKYAAHISPTAAGAVVRGHEQEHVTNAYSKATTQNGKVIQASVAIHTAVCPECGRTYVSGGTTTTTIKYYNEDNPYQKDLKLQDETKYAGRNVDAGC